MCSILHRGMFRGEKNPCRNNTNQFKFAFTVDGNEKNSLEMRLEILVAVQKREERKITENKQQFRDSV